MPAASPASPASPPSPHPLPRPTGLDLHAVPCQIDVAVNAPEAGIIKEFLANEEDTVTVGQDLVRIELGGAPAGDKPATEEAPAAPKESTPETQPEPKPQEPKQAAPPAPAKEAAPAPKQPAKPAQAAAEAPATLGSREERRVSG